MKEYTYIVKGEKYTVNINDIENNIAKVEVNGIPFDVEIDRPLSMMTSKPKPKVEVQKPAAAPAASAPKPATSEPAPAAVPAQGGKDIKAPLPGTIIDINVKVGDQVNKGDVVLILEAMKMANNINADISGTITAIKVNKGDSVMEGTPLITIA